MIESVEAWIAVATGAVALIGACVQLYRKMREARDLQEVIKVLANNVEVVEREFNRLWPNLEKALGPKEMKRLDKLAGPKAIKIRTADDLMPGRTRKRLDKILNKMGFGPKGG